MTADDGKWPRAVMRFIYDLLPAGIAPDSDGSTPPSLAIPDWVYHVASFPEALEIAQRARESSEDDVKTVEEKASRLIQVQLALLVITLALGSYQLEYALNRSWVWLTTLIPVALAVAFLALSTFEAMQIDRVGFYSCPSGAELADAQPEDVPSLILQAQVRGQVLASWSARHKTSDLMQARSWFTRGVALLLLAGTIAGIVRATSAVTLHHQSSRMAAVPVVCLVPISGEPERARPDPACHQQATCRVAEFTTN
jgi:hypothetical protein